MFEVCFSFFFLVPCGHVTIQKGGHNQTFIALASCSCSCLLPEKRNMGAFPLLTTLDCALIFSLW